MSMWPPPATACSINFTFTRLISYPSGSIPTNPVLLFHVSDFSIRNRVEVWSVTDGERRIPVRSNAVRDHSHFGLGSGASAVLTPGFSPPVYFVYVEPLEELDPQTTYWLEGNHLEFEFTTGAGTETAVPPELGTPAISILRFADGGSVHDQCYSYHTVADKSVCAGTDSEEWLEAAVILADGTIMGPYYGHSKVMFPEPEGEFCVRYQAFNFSGGRSASETVCSEDARIHQRDAFHEPGSQPWGQNPALVCDGGTMIPNPDITYRAGDGPEEGTCSARPGPLDTKLLWLPALLAFLCARRRAILRSTR